MISESLLFFKKSDIANLLALLNFYHFLIHSGFTVGSFSRWRWYSFQTTPATENSDLFTMLTCLFPMNVRMCVSFRRTCVLSWWIWVFFQTAPAAECSDPGSFVVNIARFRVYFGSLFNEHASFSDEYASILDEYRSLFIQHTQLSITNVRM